MNQVRINTDINTIEQIAIRVLSEFSGLLGPNAIAKALNAVLAVYNVEKVDSKTNEVVLHQVTQNMMTNYGKNGMIDGQKRTSAAKMAFAAEVVLVFIVKFVDRQVNKTKSVGGINFAAKLAEQIKAELADEAAQLELDAMDETDEDAE